MNQERIFYGNAGFVVDKYDEETGEELLNYLDEEGFQHTKVIDLPKNDFIHVNTESMKYGISIYGIKIAEENYDEIPGNTFTVNEFKTIWSVLRKYRNNKRIINSNDRKYLSVGNSCILVKEENINALNEFLSYLEKENFKALTENIPENKYILTNVGNNTYINNYTDEKIIKYIENNKENALSTDEFKTIWETIRKHTKK